MADLTFKANLLPNSDLGKALGSEDKRWNIYGELNGNASSADKLSHTPNNTTTFLRGDNTFSDTLNARLHTQGLDTSSDINLYTGTTDSPDIIWWYSNKQYEQARIYMGNGTTSTSGFAPLYRCFNASGTQTYSGSLVLGNGTGASGTWGISITGNANTATALTSNAGSATHPIYFSGGKPAACNIISSGNYKDGFATVFDANGYGEIGKGLDWHMPTSTNDFDIRLHIEGTHNGLGIAAGTGYNSAFTASNFYGTLNGNAQYLLTATHPGVAPTYGVNRLEYFNASTSAGNSPTAVDSPTSDWYHHLRMNHANNGGYYCDIATCFHNNNMYLKRVANGSSSGWLHIWVQGNAVTSAVWNDYAEYRESHDTEFGYVVQEIGDDTLQKTTKRLDHFAGVTSDTWGFAQGETEKAKTPIAVAGRVLVYPGEDRNKYQPGDCVCAGPDGKVYIMTREEIKEWPDRIVGIVSCVPTYDEWGGGENADRPSVKVNGRIWIKVR